MLHVSIKKDMGYLMRELPDFIGLVMLGATITMPITIFFLPVIKYFIGDIARWIDLGHIFFGVGSFITLGCFMFVETMEVLLSSYKGVLGGGYGHNHGLPRSGTKCLDCGAVCKEDNAE